MDKTKNYVVTYLNQVKEICDKIDLDAIHSLILGLKQLKQNNGRLFILGVGGSAANASHCVNDFRKILNIEAYAPTDNVAELTARINDESWSECFSNWLKGSRITNQDALFVLSVGGGSDHTSQNIVKAIELAKEKECKVFSIASKTGGACKTFSDVCVLIPVIDESLVTAHAEEWQGIVWHLLVNYNYDN